jgi:hypothetical protein
MSPGYGKKAIAGAAVGEHQKSGGELERVFIHPPVARCSLTTGFLFLLKLTKLFFVAQPERTLSVLKT